MLTQTKNIANAQPELPRVPDNSPSVAFDINLGKNINTLILITMRLKEWQIGWVCHLKTHLSLV